MAGIRSGEFLFVIITKLITGVQIISEIVWWYCEMICFVFDIVLLACSKRIRWLIKEQLCDPPCLEVKRHFEWMIGLRPCAKPCKMIDVRMRLEKYGVRLDQEFSTTHATAHCYYRCMFPLATNRHGCSWSRVTERYRLQYRSYAITRLFN